MEFSWNASTMITAYDEFPEKPYTEFCARSCLAAIGAAMKDIFDIINEQILTHGSME